MFGYVTFNVKKYILSQIFYKKIWWFFHRLHKLLFDAFLGLLPSNILIGLQKKIVIYIVKDFSNSGSLCQVRTIQVDPINHQGFSPLMKAALQGRIKCSKLLLFSGN